MQRHPLRLGAIVEVQVHVAGEGGAQDFFAKRHAGLRAGTVVQHEGLRADCQRLRHAQQRRNADATGQQQAGPRHGAEREVIPWRADGQHVTDLHILVHGTRAPAARSLLQHGDAVSMCLARIIAQRVLAGEPMRQLDVNVRACRKRRHCAASGGHEFEDCDVQRSVGLVRDTHLQARGRVGHGNGLVEADLLRSLG